MHLSKTTAAAASIILGFCASNVLAQLPVGASNTAQPRQWIDPDTGHRIVRLSDEGGSSTLYFHDTAYTPQGDKFILNTPEGVAAIEGAEIRRADQKAGVVVAGRRGAIMARKAREVYGTRRGGGGGGGGGNRGRGAAAGPASQPAEVQPG